MGTLVQLLDRSTKPAHASADAIQVNAVQMPLRATRDQAVATASKCETLSLSIAVLQRSLKTLDGIVGLIDDPKTRENVQHQMRSIDASLLFESTRLSSIKRTIQAALHCMPGDGSPNLELILSNAPSNLFRRNGTSA
jgi:hypothetical protein